MGRRKRGKDDPEYGMDNKDLIWMCLHCRRPKCNDCMSSTYAEVQEMIRKEAKKAREEYEKEHGRC